jgi:flagellar operon protein
MKAGLDPSIALPQVSTIGPQSGGAQSDPSVKPGEFDELLKGKLDANPDLGSVNRPLKFSAHANQRLAERSISLGPELLGKLTDAVSKAEQKGLNDTLVLTDEAAMIVNVKNRTVVTAMDRASLGGNVFTNIDGAVLV